jgi:hypothetical protein
LGTCGKKQEKEDQEEVVMKEKRQQQEGDICKLGGEQIGMSGIWAPGDCADCMSFL